MQNRKHRRNEIESAEALSDLLREDQDLDGWVVQGVDLSQLDPGELDTASAAGSIWLGCEFSEQQEGVLRQRGAIIFPRFNDLPYRPTRTTLYTVDELIEGYEEGGYTATRDFAIYTHSHRERRHPGGISVKEALAQRIHDHAIDDALSEFLFDNPSRGVVGVMGGHGMRRSDPFFRKVARITRRLTREGYLVVTGGGPGVMEAGNLGAWLAGHEDEGSIDRAIELLRPADTMSGGKPEGTPAYVAAIRDYIDCARQVVARLGSSGPGGVSLAVPTWFYGHEPSNLFSTAIAKYFDNSIREEGLLAMAQAGVIFAPGSAGTMQEIFQDLTQNHYATYGTRSPMVFLGRERYAAEHALIQAFLDQRSMSKVYGDLVELTDDEDRVVDFIMRHPPRPAPRRPALYELLETD